MTQASFGGESLKRRMNMVDISRFKAAVFDMDGVVVDTEPVYREHVLMFFREQGVDIGMDEVNVLAGAASDTYHRLLRQWWRDGTGKQATDQEIDALLDEFYARNRIDYASITRACGSCWIP